MRNVRFVFAICFSGLLLLAACRQAPPQQVAPVAQESEALPLDTGIALPLDLQMAVTQYQPATKIAEIEVNFTSKLDQASAKITVVLPAKTTFISGATSWEGALKQGESGQLRFSVRTEDATPRFVIARAEVTEANGRTFKQAASAYLDSEQKLQKAAAPREVSGYEGAERIQVYRKKPAN